MKSEIFWIPGESGERLGIMAVLAAATGSRMKYECGSTPELMS